MRVILAVHVKCFLDKSWTMLEGMRDVLAFHSATALYVLWQVQDPQVYLCLVQLMEAMIRKDQAALINSSEALDFRLIVNQSECHTLSLAPSQALFLEF